MKKRSALVRTELVAMFPFSYAPAPFWFLNHKLEKKEIKRQITLMKKAGVSGFFIHPRAGLLTPYGSDEWFEMVGYIIKEAKTQGLQTWLYDEDPFPSGIAGGRVVFDNPEFAARGLKIVKLLPDKAGKAQANLGQGKVVSALAIRTDNKGNVIDKKDLKAAIGIIRPNFFKTPWNNAYYVDIREKKTFEHFRAETFYPELQISTSLPETGWSVYIAVAEIVRSHGKHGFIPDNLNRECVKKFIHYTHEKYAKLFNRDFGGVIPGIFTDEPAAGGKLPWTPGFEQEFFKRKGYCIEDNYYHLVETFSKKSRRIRYDYWDVIHNLYKDNFFKQIARWCRKHSLKFCGHVICEEDPISQVIAGGNAYAYQKFFDIPGFDHITPNIADRDYPGLNFGGKLISSAAHQQGKPQVLSECFACNPFNFGPDGMEKVANWLFALGITWLVPHGFYYSYDGDRKFDAGKSFFFQDPSFPEFKNFALYAERIGGKLAKAKHICNTCLLYPVAAFWELLPAEMERAKDLRNQLYRTVRVLFEEHIEFDIIDDTTLFESPIRNGMIQCGREKYQTVVIPDKKYLLDTQLAKIMSLDKKGITVISNTEISKLPKMGCSEWTDIKKSEHGNYKCDHKDLMCLKKKNGDSIFMYIFNNSKTPGIFSVPHLKKYPYCYWYNAQDDTYQSLERKKDRIHFSIEGFKAVIIEFRKERINSAQKYHLSPDLTPITFEYERNPEWNYSPPIKYLSAIHRWDISLKGLYFKKRVKSHPFCLMRDIAGTELTYLKEKSVRPTFDQTEYKKFLYPLKASFKTKFIISAEQINKQKVFSLLCENDTFQGDCRILINNKALKKSFLRKTIYDPFNLVCEITTLLKPGVNRIHIVWANANEFDGLKSSIYIL
ncbi:MAG: glycosyl hydrolase [bacterium]